METGSNDNLGSENIPKSLFSFFFILLMTATLASAMKCKSNVEQVHTKSNETESIRERTVPFILIQREDRKNPTRVLYQSLEKYRSEVSQTMKGLSTHLEQALALEQGTRIPERARLSTKIKVRIQKLSACFDENEIMLQKILYPWDAVIALPYTSSQTRDGQHNISPTDDEEGSTNLNPSTLFQTSPKSKSSKFVDGNAYDTATQIVAHLVRDWTSSGALLREKVYHWVCDELIDRMGKHLSPQGPILVPGAGMGRLAYDIYSHGFTVEANELSPVMAAAANSILIRNVSGMLYPFAMDPLPNEVDSERRYDKVTFPDVNPRKSAITASLSFTIGDFVGDYYFNQNSTFAAVCTCFFIDTSTNIYEYLELIHSLLKPKGVWINVGPVQWHRNALLHPAVDELKDLVAAFGFEIVQWAVDSTPVPYRQDDSDSTTSFVRSTNFDAYRPLRFVAIRK